MVKSKQEILKEKYPKSVVIIHWVSAVLIIVLFPLGKYMSGLAPIDKISLIKLHAIFGVLVFILTLIRSILFFTAKRPKHLKTGAKWNDLLAIGIQRAFYILLILIGISGIATLIVGGYIDVLTTSPSSWESILARDEIMPLKMHNVLSILMVALLIMHVAGVIRFNIKHKTNVIKRIT